MGVLARRGSWSSVPWSHPHFVLEFSLISMVSVYWGNERKKEKIQRKRWDLRENEGKKERKNVVKLKEKKHLPLKTKTVLPYSSVVVERGTKFPKQVLPVTQQFLKKLLSSCGYVVKKEPHNNFFFFSCKGLHSTQWITFFWLLAACYKQLSKFND